MPLRLRGQRWETQQYGRAVRRANTPTGERHPAPRNMTDLVAGHAAGCGAAATHGRQVFTQCADNSMFRRSFSRGRVVVTWASSPGTNLALTLGLLRNEDVSGQTSTHPSPATECSPGARIDGFTVERKIGEGGMAWLYLAVDAAGRRRVLKLPRGSYDADPASLVAFENELRLAPYLEDFLHAHMPVARERDQGQYLVMDYIEGVDLWTHLRTVGCQSESEAVALAMKIVRALGELHARRIVHLDIKLSNIMITPQGEVRLIDFGLANHLDLPDHIYESFQEPKGTPAYIAPEQFFGVRDEPRSDLFSVGAMLFEMTTSRLPYPDAQSALDVVNRIRRTPVSPRTYRPELSLAFERIVMTCLENLPDRRYAGMDQLYAALEQLRCGDACVHPAGTGTPERTGADVPRMHQALRRFLRLPEHKRGDRLDELKRWIEEHRRNRAELPYRIVAALDVCDGDTRVAALNRAILREALRFATMQHSMITALAVLPSQDVGMASGDKEMQIQNAAYQKARVQMAELLHEVGTGSVNIGINVRIGETVDAIASCLTDYEADLLIIGARERSALSRFILGSTAYKVLTTIKCPTYVVQERAVTSPRRRATSLDQASAPAPIATASYVAS
jgi:nucleotide-binding universal stress UspA family protein